MRKYTSHFLLDGQYEDFLRSNGVRVEEALRKTGLPEDLFRRRAASMTAGAYFAFIEAVGDLAGDPDFPLRLGTSEGIENFSPCIFAAFCGKDGQTCLERISRYKRLVGPLEYLLESQENGVSVEIRSEFGMIPRFLLKVEFVFLLHILRKATGEAIKPVRLILRQPFPGEAFEAYAGCAAERGDKDAILFSARDLRLPFISRNDTMWEYVEPELKRRLYELSIDDSFAARVRSALTELLPGGGSGADDVAEKLGVSRRTLQRKLCEEGTTFREQLNHVRELLAKHYLRNTDYPVTHIAFLLGYQEVNSFQHSFRAWTGVTVGAYRNSVLQAESDSPPQHPES